MSKINAKYSAFCIVLFILIVFYDLQFVNIISYEYSTILFVNLL